ncbi:MAG TPA: TonB-dependent receptor [Gemmatimonadales bacterium]|nr:TonB-dependent receptor [Gemmatimonadales bacterium]
MGLGLFLASSLSGQARRGDAAVRGTVIGTDERPIAFAIVELRAAGDSVAIRSAQSSEAGRFQLDSIAAGVYYVLIRRIGFGPATTPNFTVVQGQLRDLGRIRLQEAARQLNPIVVTVERPDVSFEPDRTGYLVEALGTAAGGAVTDALRQLPDVAIDLDGTITLRGNPPAIFINGRPAPMQGVSLQVFMEQFPADRIERIEVLDAPPTRYSAEGAGGIINIVLKQGVELGLTGNLNLAAGTRGQYTAGGRATLQRGPLLFNGGLDSRWGDSRTSNLTVRQNLLANPVSFLRQDASANNSSRNGGVQLDVRYELSKKSRFSGHFGGNLNGNDRTGLTETTHLDELQDSTLQYARHSRTNGDGAAGDTRFGWEYVWQPERHSLEFNVSAQKNHSGNTIREEIAADPAYQGDPLLPAWLTRRQDGSTSSGISAELAYTRPLGKQGRIEAGSSIRRNPSNDDQATSLFEEQGSVIPDAESSLRISRVQRVGALYLSAQRRLGKFAIVTGLRGELVGETIRFPLGDLLQRDDHHVFPSVNLSWNPRQRMVLRIGYGQRINRPGVGILDPTNRSTDPLNRSVGNPEIESSVTHNINLGFNWGGKLGQLSVGPYWNRTENGWERVTTVDAEGVSTSTWSNLTTRTNLGASVNWTPPRVKEWAGRVMLSASGSRLSGSLRPAGLENGQLRWSVAGSLGGPVIQGIMAQGNFGFEPGRDLVQGRTSGQWRADFSFRYRLMRNRTSVGLSVTDPFELRKTTQIIQDPSVIQTGRNRVTTRSMTINLSYAFGGGRSSGGGPVPMKRD